MTDGQGLLGHVSPPMEILLGYENRRKHYSGSRRDKTLGTEFPILILEHQEQRLILHNIFEDQKKAPYAMNRNGWM